MSENTSNEKTSSQSADGIDNNTNESVVQIEEQPIRPYVPINRELIREEMVKTAVNFLLNPRVIDSPLTQKRTFLLRKGLSLEEIDVAIDRWSRLTRNQTSQPINPNNYSPQQMNGYTIGPVVPLVPSFLSRSSQFVSNVTLFGGFIYGTYVFYKRFIEPLLFEKSRKPHSCSCCDQLFIAMDLLKDNLSAIEINIKKQIEDELRVIRTPQDVTIHELKSELASIKALLVNRRQFTSTPVGSIPLWQINEKKGVNSKSDIQIESEDIADKTDDISSIESNGFHNMTNESVPVNGDQNSTISGLQD